MSSRGRDAGSASVMVMALGTAIVLIAATIATAGSSMLAVHRASNVADLAAVAAAQRGLVDQGRACRAARSVALANHATLLSCRLDGVDAVVSVQVAATKLRLKLPRSSVATARAGPVEG